MGLGMYLSAEVTLGDRDKRALAVFEVIAREYPNGTEEFENEDDGGGIGLFDLGKLDPRAKRVKDAIAKHFPVVLTDYSWIGAGFNANRITIPLIYWRKANSIHAWFVREVQNGIDECQRSEVPREKLADLAKRIGEIAADHSKASELLPPQEGFFFGSYHYDEYYFDELQATADGLTRMRKCGLTEATKIYYRASW